MKLKDLRDTATTGLSFHHREYTVNVSIVNRAVRIYWQYDSEPEGSVTFDISEIAPLTAMLSAFFIEENQGQGETFFYDASLQTHLSLPMVTLGTTSWAAPYARGVMFTFTHHADQLAFDTLSFSIEETDARSLLTFLENNHATIQ